MIPPKEATKHFKRQCEYKRLEVICSLLKEGDRVLDVGCGIGTYTSDPLSCLPIKVTAIDSDLRTIQYMQESNCSKNVEFFCVDGEHFDSDWRYDVIVCSHTLEHVSAPIVLLGNLKRLLKDDGILYLAIPNGFGAFEAQNLLPRLLSKSNCGRELIHKMAGKGKDTLNTESPHICFFTASRVRRLLLKAGFKIERQSSDEFLGGIVFDKIFSKVAILAKWNTNVAGRLPMRMTNGWIFVCRKS